MVRLHRRPRVSGIVDRSIYMSGEKYTGDDIIAGEIDRSSNHAFSVYSPADFNLGDSADSGSCVGDINGKRTGICQDGIYTFRVKSTDAAGNGSDTLEFDIERDTVSPSKPVLDEPYIYGSSIYAVINGEIGSYVYINGRKIEELKSGNQLIKIRNEFSYDKIYQFNIQLSDRAGNRSEILYI